MKTLTTCLAFILLFQFTNTLTATCIEDDYIALRALYLSTDGDNWTDNTGWPNETFFLTNPTLPAGTDVGTWFGVFTFASGCVYQINLFSNNLVGTIPTELEYLSVTYSINLSTNQLSGIIPPEFWNIPDLYYVVLSNNQLTGSLHPSMGDLFLGSLHLSNNQLSGCYPSNLTSLCIVTGAFISDGNNFDATWNDFCDFGSGMCIVCPPIVHAEVESADVYLDDACYGVILTSPGGFCYRIKVEDDGSLISESVSCP